MLINLYLQLKKKIEKSAKILDKLKNASIFSEQDPDLEIISEEERECLRQIGLKINSSLVLGKKKAFLISFLKRVLFLSTISVYLLIIYTTLT